MRSETVIQHKSEPNALDHDVVDQAPGAHNESHNDVSSETCEELYFLLDNKQSAEILARALEKDEAAEVDSIKSITSIEQNAEELRGLDRATAFERSDLAYAAPRGGLLGVLMAMGLGMVLMVMPSFAAHLSVGVLLLMMILGGLIGAWFSTLIGVSVPHPRLQDNVKGLSQELDRGRVLVLVTVKPTLRRYITQVTKHLLDGHVLATGRI